MRSLLRLALFLFEAERALFRLVLASMCVHLLRNAWRLRSVPCSPAAPAPLPSHPRVTVQLPIRNEFHVAERALRAAAALDYPRERLQVQVLDDSDDETCALLDRVAAELAREGRPVEIVRRGTLEGGKAGNLQSGLRSATGEHVAIFDADFVPPPDFLARTLPPLIADDRVGLVEGRSDFPDREATVLTRVQALMLDGLMRLDMAVKSDRGRPVHFNGSAGVWRRRCIDDCGGFALDMVAEDLDLSYRALLRGWRLVHRADVAVPSELPRSLAAFRAQQRRWTAGKAQVLRRQGGAILAGGALPARHRLDMLLRIFSRLLYPFLAILTLSAPLTTFGWIRPTVRYTSAEDLAVFATVLASLAVYYGAASRRRLEAALLSPVVCALVLGLSFSGTAAIASGLWGRPAFAPTPKPGAGPGPRYRAAADPLAFLEAAAGLAYVFFAALALQRRFFPAAAFFAFVAASYVWVGVGSLVRR